LQQFGNVGDCEKLGCSRVRVFAFSHEKTPPGMVNYTAWYGAYLAELSQFRRGGLLPAVGLI
jgi:hypothetical protein